MTTNPIEATPAPAEAETAPVAAAEPSTIVEVLITADHVYMPIAERGIVQIDWAATNIETTRISKGEHLLVPRELAKTLIENDQAVIL